MYVAASGWELTREDKVKTKMTVGVISEMASRLFAPSASPITGVLKSAVEKSEELWRETRKQMMDAVPRLFVHLPPDDHQLQRAVDKIAINAATIYPTANTPDQ